MNSRYCPASVKTQDTVSMSALGLREPLGWQVAGLPAVGEGRGQIFLSWPPDVRFEAASRLRITVLDTREAQNQVEIRLTQSGRVVGTFDIRWAAHFQVFEVALSAQDTADLLSEGGVLRPVEGNKPLWVLVGGSDDTTLRQSTPLPLALSPHLLPESKTEKRAEFFARLDSMACLQSYGWQEGCVLDGLRDLSQLPPYSYLKGSLHQHLGVFFRGDGQLVYESYHCQPSDNVLNTIEATLPFATLCQEFPDHPALKLALDFWESRIDGEGVIQDGSHTSTEGSYTVGYPLAVYAQSRDDKKLAQSALTQIRLRHQRLFDGQRLPRWRTQEQDGTLHFGNVDWARGVSWQLLGAARTLRVLEDWLDIEAARAEFAELATWALGHQLPNGLWSVFLRETELLPDTSGSAGIAAAFAIGAKQGWLGNEFLNAARVSEQALDKFLTPDGFLCGASQPNKGGEELQRAPYRPIYQMGMGLFAQLIAALAPNEDTA